MRRFIFTCGLVLLFMGPGVLFAQQESSSTGASDAVPSGQETQEPDMIPGGMQGFISLDLRDIDMVDALKFLSLKANLDIVTTRAVGGRVTLMVENVLVKDVFDIMLRSNNLAYDRQGEIYNVMTQQEYGELYGAPFADPRVVKTIRLRYAIPEQAFSLLDTLKSDIGRVLVDPESGNVLIFDTPEKIRQMEEALEAFEQRNLVRIFPLQYANAKDIEEQLKVQLDSKNVGLVRADERMNQVMIQTLPDRMEEMERLIRKLDTKTRQVIIDVNIIKIRLFDENTKGIEWEGLFDSGQQRSLVYLGSTPFATVQSATDDFKTRRQAVRDAGYVGSFPFSGTTSSFSSSVPKTGFEEVHIGIIGAQDADFIINYVKTLGSTKILANPKLVVTNNQESRIHVGERQAYVTTTTTTGQVTSTVAEDVTFVDVGTQFSVTPVINDDGYVTMTIKTEISSVTSTLVTPTQNRIPIIDTSLAETTVMVREGTTIIMGGLRKEEKSMDGERTPFLSRIPIVGEIFKKKTTSVEYTELLIMLTPRIISGDVLVTEAGQRVEHAGIKGQRGYGVDQRPAADLEFSGAVPSVSEESVVFKGLRIAR